MIGKTVLFIFLVLLTVVNYCSGCSCYPSHYQQKLCDADYAVKAVVKSEEILHWSSEVEKNGTLVNVSSPMERKYTIKIQRILKDSEAFQNASKKYVFTSYLDSMCGVKLRKKARYLLIGQVIENSLIIGLCDGPTEWKLLTSFQKKGVSYMYKKQCGDCEIVPCFGEDCDDAKRRDTCVLNGSDNWTSGCAIEHGQCKLTRVGGHCRWSPRRRVMERKCLESRLP